MKCNLPIDWRSGDALEGERLEAALKNPSAPRCPGLVNGNDYFCPMCGGSMKVIGRVRGLDRKARREGTAAVDDARISRSEIRDMIDNVRDDVRWLGIDVIVRTFIGMALFSVVAIWGWGAFNAHDDVARGRPLGLVLKRMYGTEYNSLTRHGYRMYIKHFTTVKGMNDDKGLEERVKNMWEETVGDIGAYFKENENDDGEKLLKLIRERAADAAGDLATGL